MSCLHPLSGVPIHLYTLRVCVCLHLLLIYGNCPFIRSLWRRRCETTIHWPSLAQMILSRRYLGWRKIIFLFACPFIKSCMIQILNLAAVSECVPRYINSAVWFPRHWWGNAMLNLEASIPFSWWCWSELDTQVMGREKEHTSYRLYQTLFLLFHVKQLWALVYSPLSPLSPLNASR